MPFPLPAFSFAKSAIETSEYCTIFLKNVFIVGFENVSSKENEKHTQSRQ